MRSATTYCRGREITLYEKARPEARPVLDAGPRQRIIAMGCGDPPEGYARWTVRLIAQEALNRKLVPEVGRESILALLRSHDLTPWWTLTGSTSRKWKTC